MGKPEKLRAEFDFALKQYEMSGQLIFASVAGGLLVFVAATSIVLGPAWLAGVGLWVVSILLLIKGVQARNTKEKDKDKINSLIKKMG